MKTLIIAIDLDTDSDEMVEGIEGAICDSLEASLSLMTLDSVVRTFKDEIIDARVLQLKIAHG